MRRTLSTANNAKGGKKIVTLRNILEMAVYKTAALAASFDLPNDSPVSGSNTLIPFSISVCLMNQAFMNPALAQAKKELILLSTMRPAPVAAAALADMAFRRASPTQIDETQATL